MRSTASYFLQRGGNIFNYVCLFVLERYLKNTWWKKGHIVGQTVSSLQIFCSIGHKPCVTSAVLYKQQRHYNKGAEFIKYTLFSHVHSTVQSTSQSDV